MRCAMQPTTTAQYPVGGLNPTVLGSDKGFAAMRAEPVAPYGLGIKNCWKNLGNSKIYACIF